MNDITFWPTAEQAARVAKSYRPGENQTGLVETTVTQVQYPLSSRINRYPMPAGGLFASATDMAKFYHMLASNGGVNGKRCLSVESIKMLTSKQTADGLPNENGFGNPGTRAGISPALNLASYLRLLDWSSRLLRRAWRAMWLRFLIVWAPAPVAGRINWKT